MGVGNDIKGDDGVGPFFINQLDNKIQNDNVILINATTVPENFTGKIKNEDPSHIIFVDACLMDEEPGTVKIVNPKDFSKISMSTHSMSLSFFVKYLKSFKDYKIIFIGVEPLDMSLGNDLSDVVKNNSLKMIENIIKNIK